MSHKPSQTYKDFLAQRTGMNPKQIDEALKAQKEINRRTKKREEQ